MRRRNGLATAKEKKFAKAYALGGNEVAAAMAAGYKQPQVSGYALRDRPIVREMTRQALEEFVRTQAGQIGVAVLVELAEDEKVPASTRRAAAKDLTEISGVSKNVSGSKDLSEMTGEELQAAIASAKARAIAAEHLAAERAQPILDGSASVVEAGGDMFE